MLGYVFKNAKYLGQPAVIFILFLHYIDILLVAISSWNTPKNFSYPI